LEQAVTDPLESDLVVAATGLNGPKAAFRIDDTPATMITH